MKKSTFATLVLGIVGGLLFSLGMCMALVEEWAMLNEGIIMGIAGAVVLLVALSVYRKATGKAPIKIRFKTVLKILYGIFATLVFGAGMCLVLAVEGMISYGIGVGIVGIVLLLFLLPMCLGFKENKKEEEIENV